MRVVDIDSEDAFDKTIQSASGALVVVDYYDYVVRPV
jgi:hypothetical protein